MLRDIAVTGRQGFRIASQLHEYARARAAHGRTVAARDSGTSAWSEWLCTALGTGAVRGDMAGLCQDLQPSLKRAIKEFHKV